jgi:hypothetical protein
MTIEYLENLTIDEIFKLKETTYYQGSKWDYEFGMEFYEEFEDHEEESSQAVIKFTWLERGEIELETVDSDTLDSLIQIGSYTIILDEVTSEIYVFDTNLLCDGVTEGFFTFNDYDLTLTRNRKTK